MFFKSGDPFNGLNIATVKILVNKRKLIACNKCFIWLAFPINLNADGLVGSFFAVQLPCLV